MSRPNEDTHWFGDLRPILDDDLARFVAEQDRHRSLTVVADPRDHDAEADTRRWLDALRADPATTDQCAAMVRAVERHADGSRDGMLRGALAVVRLDELGHAGVAAALDQLWSVRAKDRRDYDRVIAFARRRVVESPSPANRRGCRCRPPVEQDDEPTKDDEPKKSTATRLVEMAEMDYTLGCTDDGEPFGVPKVAPFIVATLRGSRHSLRAKLAQSYFTQRGTAPSQSALADALMVLEGKAQQCEPEPLHLRVARDKDDLVLDLGDATGSAVVINSAGWRVTADPPVHFRRTALTGALPAPIGGATLDEVLWPVLNIAEKYRPLVAGVLVAALLPDLPHPVVLLTGEQGTAKSTTTARLGSILDPSPAQVRKAPRDVESWTTAAAGSWTVCLDNLSDIPDWLSDALCRASTGDGDVRRRLFTDGDLHVVAFRRCVILNGIDVGALRGDLADRTVHLPLDRIPATSRREDRALTEEWARTHPRVLGAVLDLAVRVLAVLPSTVVESPPRMADLARVLAAVDSVLGTDGLDTYRRLGRDLAEDAAGSDPVLVAMVKALGRRDEWTGASGDLLPLLRAAATPADEHGRPVDGWRPPKGWPATARALTGQLKRVAPMLRLLGWTVEEIDRNASRTKQITWRLVPPPDPADDGECPQREAVEGAADAAVAASALSAQVNEGAPGAANGAATVRQTRGDAASAATEDSSPHVAAPVAAPHDDAVSSGNEDHAASAANAAPSPVSLRQWRKCACGNAIFRANATQCGRCELGTTAASAEPTDPPDSADTADIADTSTHRRRRRRRGRGPTAEAS